MGIPKRIYERYKYIVLTADVMFVNRIVFLVSLSRGSRLYTCEHVPAQKAHHLPKVLCRIINLCARGGFRVRTIMMDMEFEKFKEQEGMELVDVNTTAAREHVGKIERGIRYLKERCRCSVSTFAITGIKFLAKPIVIWLIYNITVLVNAVPDPLGVSERYSPREIVTQRKFDFKRDYRVQFGAYV